MISNNRGDRKPALTRQDWFAVSIVLVFGGLMLAGAIVEGRV